MLSRVWYAPLLLVAQVIVAATPNTGVPGWAPVSGDVERGAARSAELFCDACHGTAGNSTTPEWPSLAGQQPGYMVEQLILFRAKRRTSSEMEPMAATLTDADLVDLASYFAAQTLVTPASVNLAELGERLYGEGDASRGIAPCGSCHGMDGRGDNSLRAPAVRRQQSTYVVKQLQAYAQRSRYTADAPPGAEAMSEAAARLTPEEMSALAGWLQRLH